MTRYLLVALTLALAPLVSLGADTPLKNAVTGSPKVKSIDVIAFGPQGTLLIGDSAGSQIVAVETKDTTVKPWKAKPIAKIEETIAGKLGTTAKNIEIVHLTVNPASGTAYLAVRNQNEKKTVIVTIDGDGKIGEFTLDKVNYVAVPLPKNDKAPAPKITDLAWAKDRVLVGGLAREMFACKVYSIPTPLDAKNKTTGFSTETYHVAHRRWETAAPITTLMPLEHKGKQYVVGAFACTPVVRYSLDDIKDGAKVKGQSVVELGSGNRPLNMFTYKKGDRAYVLVNTFRFHHARAPISPSPYWVARIDFDIFEETEKINEKALLRIDGKRKPTTNRVKMIDAFHGVVMMDKLNDKQALVIQDESKGSRTLKALDLP